MILRIKFSFYSWYCKIFTPKHIRFNSNRISYLLSSVSCWSSGQNKTLTSLQFSFISFFCRSLNVVNSSDIEFCQETDLHTFGRSSPWREQLILFLRWSNSCLRYTFHNVRDLIKLEFISNKLSKYSAFKWVTSRITL